MPVFCILCLSTLLIWHSADWSLRLAQAAMGLACAAGLAVMHPTHTRFSPAQFVAGACLAAATLVGLLQNAFAISVIPWQTWSATLEWGALAAVFVAVSIATSSPIGHQRFLTACASFSIAICLLAMAQFYTSNGKLFWLWPTSEPHVLGPFLSRNNYASFAALFLPVVLWKGVAGRCTNWYWLSAAAALFASVIASGSRAGALLATIELPVFFLLLRNRPKYSAAGFALLAITSVGIAGWELLGVKLTGENSVPYRKEMLVSAIHMTQVRPATGWGLGVFPQVYPRFASFDSGHFVNHAHNDWAEWASEGGLGLPLIMAVFACLSLKSALCRPYTIGLAAVFLHALVDYPMQRLGLAAWVITLAALAPSPHPSPRKSDPFVPRKSDPSGPSTASVTL